MRIMNEIERFQSENYGAMSVAKRFAREFYDSVRVGCGWVNGDCTEFDAWLSEFFKNNAYNPNADRLLLYANDGTDANDGANVYLSEDGHNLIVGTDYLIPITALDDMPTVYIQD